MCSSSLFLKRRKRVAICEKHRDVAGSLDRDSGLVAALRRHEPRAADALVDTYGGRAEPPRAHILEACPTTGPRRTSNKQAVGGTNDGCDGSGSADPPPRHLRQGRSRRSHGRLFARVAAVHLERDVEGARGHSATVTTQFKEFAKPGASFQMLRQDVDGDTAYILWKAETADNRYEIGTDTFVVKDGKIVTQTSAGKITPKH